MTVLNGDGLVGRVTTVGPDTATVLLANDPDFTVGTRMEATDELGFATGQGSRPMAVQFLNGKAKVRKGDRLVTFGSSKDKPFVPGVPVGEVVRVDPSGGDLTRTVYVRPYVGFTKLDIVGIVVQAPREDPRDAVLPKKPAKPAKPKPTPTVTVTISPNGDIVDTGGNVVGNIHESADPSGNPDPSPSGNATPNADNAVNEQR